MLQYLLGRKQSRSKLSSDAAAPSGQEGLLFLRGGVAWVPVDVSLRITGELLGSVTLEIVPQQLAPSSPTSSRSRSGSIPEELRHKALPEQQQLEAQPPAVEQELASGVPYQPSEQQAERKLLPPPPPSREGRRSLAQITVIKAAPAAEVAAAAATAVAAVIPPKLPSREGRRSLVLSPMTKAAPVITDNDGNWRSGIALDSKARLIVMPSNTLPPLPFSVSPQQTPLFFSVQAGNELLCFCTFDATLMSQWTSNLRMLLQVSSLASLPPLVPATSAATATSDTPSAAKLSPRKSQLLIAHKYLQSSPNLCPGAEFAKLRSSNVRTGSLRRDSSSLRKRCLQRSKSEPSIASWDFCTYFSGDVSDSLVEAQQVRQEEAPPALPIVPLANTPEIQESSALKRNPSNGVEAGTAAALLDVMCDPSVSNSINSDYVTVMLFTHRYFISSEKLLEYLIHRYRNPTELYHEADPTNLAPLADVVQLRVLYVLSRWATDHKSLINTKLANTFVEFLAETVEPQHAVWSDFIKQTLCSQLLLNAVLPILASTFTRTHTRQTTNCYC
eukprot:TRINITY_DN299_c0_g1_i2.p1 TRINITY_DN299_c0_g1~~TRINITY_DN299_c0_g1_i2.p1  ORF type:complete len:559 (-),score=112.36 TRINITY_DN299_c0_g1_i2:1207-2883(-)